MDAISRDRTRERTLVVLKPDAVERKLVGKIIARFEEAGLRIVAAKMVYATAENLDRHFPSAQEWIENMGIRAVERVRNELGEDPVKCFGTRDPCAVGQKIADGCRDYYFSGPVVPLVLEGADAVKTVRALLGNTLPEKAAKGTIRGDFGIPTTMETLVLGAARNLVHASDSPSEAARETAAWFAPEEVAPFAQMSALSSLASHQS